MAGWPAGPAVESPGRAQRALGEGVRIEPGSLKRRPKSHVERCRAVEPLVVTNRCDTFFGRPCRAEAGPDGSIETPPFPRARFAHPGLSTAGPAGLHAGRVPPACLQLRSPRAETAPSSITIHHNLRSKVTRWDVARTVHGARGKCGTSRSA